MCHEFYKAVQHLPRTKLAFYIYKEWLSCTEGDTNVGDHDTYDDDHLMVNCDSVCSRLLVKDNCLPHSSLSSCVTFDCQLRLQSETASFTRMQLVFDGSTRLARNKHYRVPFKTLKTIKILNTTTSTVVGVGRD